MTMDLASPSVADMSIMAHSRPSGSVYVSVSTFHIFEAAEANSHELDVSVCSFHIISFYPHWGVLGFRYAAFANRYMQSVAGFYACSHEFLF